MVEDGRGFNESQDSSLSNEQLQILQHFMDMSGIANRAEAMAIMVSSGWRLEHAVENFFGIPGATGENSEVRRRNDVGTTADYIPPVDTSRAHQPVIRSHHIVRHSGWWWPFFLLVDAFMWGYHALVGFSRTVFLLFWPGAHQRVTDPVGDVQRFADYFKTTYVDSATPTTQSTSTEDNSLLPPFFVDTYATALKEAKKSVRILIVYLHDDAHEDTDRFCRNILLDKDFLSLLRLDGQVMFWACNAHSPEGYRVSQTLRTRTYPFLGFIGLSNNSGTGPISSCRMTLLSFFERYYDPGAVVEVLNDLLFKNTTFVALSREEKREREASARLRQEQDEAYAISLAQDRAKQAAREEQQRLEVTATAEEQMRLRRAEALLHARAARKRRWRQCLPPQPSQMDPATSVELSVKLPNGSRFSRVFPGHDSMKLLYYAVVAEEDSPANFDVQTMFPKRMLNCCPADESDVEQDYLTDAEKSTLGIAGSTGRPVKVTEQMVDWRPSAPGDPPSFFDSGLRKSEMLYVIDRDA